MSNERQTHETANSEYSSVAQFTQAEQEKLKGCKK
jgi:hypothetical protein